MKGTRSIYDKSRNISKSNPLALELSRKVTQGIVSAVDRTIAVSTSQENGI
ncbi:MULTISPECIES: hypothetical protein [Bacillaceae]|uniref:hypothetical protein n=1 Tax=Bacillaceae TaxID=186817 RepID=UPI00030617B0